MAKPVGILGPVPAVRGLGFAWKQTGLGSGDLTQHQFRTPVYAVRIDVDWRQGFISQNLLQTTLAPPVIVSRAPIYSNPREAPYHVELRSWFGSLPPVTAAPFNQSYWPVPTAPPRLDQTITASYNLNLIGQDQLPVGEHVSDLPPREYLYYTQLRTWTWNYNLNLIGKDQLPVGDRVLDLTPRPYEFHVQLRNWTWMYNLNLIGQDQLPTGDRVFDLPPKGPLQPIPILVASYNLNLIGQDQLPVGERIFNLPPLPPPSLFQTWINSYNLALNSVAQNPFTQNYWPLTPLPFQINRTIGASYNLNLIGQDQLPIGDRVTDLVPRPYPDGRTWVWSYNLNLIGQDKLNPGKQIYDLTPIAPLQILPRSWTWSYNLNLIGQDQLPVGKIVTELPKAPLQPIPILTASYNKNLIGQDQLPVGERVIDLPPQPALSAIQLRTWINSVLLTLNAIQPPFKQTSWPINPGPQWPIQTFVASYNKNLIGKDKLPVGKAVFDIPPRTAQPPIPIFVASFNKNLIGQDKLPNRQQDWPIPRGYEYPIQLRSSIFFPQKVPPPVGIRPYNQYDWPVPRGSWDGLDRTIAVRSQFLTPFVPPPVPELPNIEHTMVRDWWDRDEWGNFYPGAGVRRG